MPKDPLRDRRYFFDDGIRFSCRRCGNCCTGDPGTVYVDSEKAAEVADYLALPFSAFKTKYLYPFRDGFSIREDSDGRCLFYRDGCLIYPVRPLQCQTFPFWFSTLRSHEKWLRVAAQCPGIGQGRLYTKEKILEIIGPQLP